MKLQTRLGAALTGILLSLLLVSAYEFVFEPNTSPTLRLVFRDLRLAVLEYKAKRYSVKTWFKRVFTAAPSKQSFPELQAFVIKRT